LPSFFYGEGALPVPGAGAMHVNHTAFPGAGLAVKLAGSPASMIREGALIMLLGRRFSGDSAAALTGGNSTKHNKKQKTQATRTRAIAK
jgi:hypothetical protein